MHAERERKRKRHIDKLSDSRVRQGIKSGEGGGVTATVIYAERQDESEAECGNC